MKINEVVEEIKKIEKENEELFKLTFDTQKENFKLFSENLELESKIAVLKGANEQLNFVIKELYTKIDELESNKLNTNLNVIVEIDNKQIVEFDKRIRDLVASAMASGRNKYARR